MAVQVPLAQFGPSGAIEGSKATSLYGTWSNLAAVHTYTVAVSGYWSDDEGRFCKPNAVWTNVVSIAPQPMGLQYPFVCSVARQTGL